MRHAILVTIVALGPVGADAATLHLLCDGTAGADRGVTSSGVVVDGRGHMAVGSMTTDQRINFDDSVGIRLNDDDSGEARLPRKMLPLVRSGKDGWYQLIKVTRSADEINGMVRLNAYNKPKIRLDRITGRITVQGPLGDFTGQCQAYDPDKVERKF